MPDPQLMELKWGYYEFKLRALKSIIISIVVDFKGLLSLSEVMKGAKVVFKRLYEALE